MTNNFTDYKMFVFVRHGQRILRLSIWLWGKGRSKKQLLKVLFRPSHLFYPPCDRTFCFSIRTGYSQRYLADKSHVFRTLITANAAGILPKRDIKNVMQWVFYPPMSADGFGKLIGVGRKAGYKMPPFACYFAVFFPLRVNNSYSPYCFPQP